MQRPRLEPHLRVNVHRVFLGQVLRMLLGVSFFDFITGHRDRATPNIVNTLELCKGNLHLRKDRKQVKNEQVYECYM